MVATPEVLQAVLPGAVQERWFRVFLREMSRFEISLFSAGKLFYLDPDAGGTGCHCRPDWSVYYWGETGECFEQVRYEKTIEFPTKWQRKKA